MTTPGLTTHPLVPPVPPLRVGPRSDGGDALWIDPERAQGVIDKLRQVAKDVQKSGAKCRALVVEPHARDEISINVAHQANEMNRRAETFCLAWAGQLSEAALRLEEQLRAYRATEEDNRRLLAGGRA